MNVGLLITLSILFLNFSPISLKQYGVHSILNGQLLFRHSSGGGYKVIRSHIDEGKDFFEYEPDHWDIMISNPPFSKKDKVLERAFSFNKPFALLLPANSIQGKARFKIFQNDIQMLCFDSRIGFHINGDMKNFTKSPSFGSAYFCRDFLPSKLELRELHRYEGALIE